MNTIDEMEKELQEIQERKEGLEKKIADEKEREERQRKRDEIKSTMKIFRDDSINEASCEVDGRKYVLRLEEEEDVEDVEEEEVEKRKSIYKITQENIITFLTENERSEISQILKHFNVKDSNARSRIWIWNLSGRKNGHCLRHLR